MWVLGGGGGWLEDAIMIVLLKKMHTIVSGKLEQKERERGGGGRGREREREKEREREQGFP